MRIYACRYTRHLGQTGVEIETPVLGVFAKGKIDLITEFAVAQAFFRVAGGKNQTESQAQMRKNRLLRR